MEETKFYIAERKFLRQKISFKWLEYSFKWLDTSVKLVPKLGEITFSTGKPKLTAGEAPTFQGFWYDKVSGIVII